MDWHKIIVGAIKDNWLKKLVWYNMSKKSRRAKHVSTFLKEQLDSELVETVIDEIGLRKFDGNPDYQMLLILRWVKKNIKYVTDDRQYGEVEYWATFDETVTSKKGDCEDGATVIWTLATVAGIPGVFHTCGTVDGGGHAWVSYIAKCEPYVLKFLDWCYWYDRKAMANRKSFQVPLKVMTISGDDKRYKKFWWLSDKEGSYRGK